MIKISVLIAVLAAAFLFLVLYTVPNQGGLISTTQLNQSDLQNASSQLTEKVPIQETHTSINARQGRSMFIAVAMLGHVVLANLQLGGAWLIPITELLYLKSRRERFRRLARSQTLFNVIFFSIGATFALGGMLFFAGLFPVLVQNEFHIYWWPLFLEALTFAGEITFLYSYWYTWDRISPGWHQVLGWALAIDVFLQQLFINTMAAGMLTTGAETISWGYEGILTMAYSTLWAWWSNQTVWILSFHRLTGAISMYGFVIAAIAMLHYLDRKDRASRQYWDWVGTYGMAFGLVTLALQPGWGIIYMIRIMDNQNTAFQMIMHGPRAWEMLWMVTLLSTLLISSLIYFIDRHKESFRKMSGFNVYPFWKILVGFAAVAGFLLANPAWFGTTFVTDPNATTNPFGSMDYKYIALFTVSTISALVVGSAAFILGNLKNEPDWGNLGWSPRSAAILSGILAMWIIITMGFVRESARAPWTFYDIVPIPGGTAYPAPLSVWNIVLVWAGVLAFAITVFWLVSRITAEQPGEADYLIPIEEAWQK